MSESRKCPYCGEEIPGDSTRCHKCNTPLPPPPPFPPTLPPTPPPTVQVPVENPQEETIQEETIQEEPIMVPDQGNMNETPPEKKPKKGLLIGLIIAAVILIGGGITVAILLINNNKRAEKIEQIDADDDDYDDDDYLSDKGNKAKREKHYVVNTKISGNPVIIKLNIDRQGNVNGEYAYESTLHKNGDASSSWTKLTGLKNGDVISMTSSHPQYGDGYENWEVTLDGYGNNAELSGTMTNFKQGKKFFVGSDKSPQNISSQPVRKSRGHRDDSYDIFDGFRYYDSY